jgi:hypothetical protein
MTMKSLLLGAAAGLLTVSVAQAADLPMAKAEAVEYVKVCQEHGEGFFYIPGTDTCLRVSGEVRADYRFFNRETRADDVTDFRTQGRIKFDARTATEYGTLRSFFQVNALANDGEFDFVIDKAFIQFGGFTAGFAHTFFGLYDNDYANTVFAGYAASQNTVNLLAYTATFGGGFSATVSIEDGKEHRAGLIDLSGPDDTYGGQSMPDIVANIRVDQAWGKAQLSGAVHQIRYPVEIDADYGWAVAASVGINHNVLGGGWLALEATYVDGAGNYIGDASDDFVFSSATGDTDGVRGWSIVGEIALNVSPVWQFVAFGSYADVESADVTAFSGPPAVRGEVGGQRLWTAGINSTYTVVPGLTIAAEVAYSDVNLDSDTDFGIDEDGDWQGGVRIKRVF